MKYKQVILLVVVGSLLVAGVGPVAANHTDGTANETLTVSIDQSEPIPYGNTFNVTVTLHSPEDGNSVVTQNASITGGRYLEKVDHNTFRVTGDVADGDNVTITATWDGIVTEIHTRVGSAEDVGRENDTKFYNNTVTFTGGMKHGSAVFSTNYSRLGIPIDHTYDGDDFDSYTTVGSNTFMVENGVVVGEGDSGSAGYTYLPYNLSSGSQITGRLYRTDLIETGIVFGYQNQSNHYRVGANGTNITLEKVSGGTYTTLDQFSASGSKNTSFTINWSDTINVSFGNYTQSLSATDSRFTSGNVGWYFVSSSFGSYSKIGDNLQFTADLYDSQNVTVENGTLVLGTYTTTQKEDFEGFEDGDISEYTFDAGGSSNVQVDGSYTTEGSYGLHMEGGRGNNVRLLRSNAGASSGSTITVDIRPTSSGYGGFVFGYDGNSWYEVRIDSYSSAGASGTGIRLYEYSGGSYTLLDKSKFSASYSTWYTVTIEYNQNSVSASTSGYTVSASTAPTGDGIGFHSFRNSGPTRTEFSSSVGSKFDNVDVTTTNTQTANSGYAISKYSPYTEEIKLNWTQSGNVTHSVSIGDTSSFTQITSENVWVNTTDGSPVYVKTTLSGSSPSVDARTVATQNVKYVKNPTLKYKTKSDATGAEYITEETTSYNGTLEPNESVTVPMGNFTSANQQEESGSFFYSSTGASGNWSFTGYYDEPINENVSLSEEYNASVNVTSSLDLRLPDQLLSNETKKYDVLRVWENGTEDQYTNYNISTNRTDLVAIDQSNETISDNSSQIGIAGVSATSTIGNDSESVSVITLELSSYDYLESQQILIAAFSNFGYMSLFAIILVGNVVCRSLTSELCILVLVGGIVLLWSLGLVPTYMIYVSALGGAIALWIEV